MAKKTSKQEVINEQELQIELLRQAVYQLVDEIQWETRVDHHELAVKALMAAGVSVADIRGYFSGNIIL